MKTPKQIAEEVFKREWNKPDNGITFAQIAITEAIADRDKELARLTKDRDDWRGIAERGGIECDQLRAELVAIKDNKAVLQAGLEAVNSLIEQSHGVVGLHLNGDVAPWSELQTGGRYEDWLIKFDDALKSVAPTAGEKELSPEAIAAEMRVHDEFEIQQPATETMAKDILGNLETPRTETTNPDSAQECRELGMPVAPKFHNKWCGVYKGSECNCDTLPAKTVPLEAGDVPIGSAIRHPSWNHTDWVLVIYNDKDGVGEAVDGLKLIKFNGLFQDGWQINRNDGRGWVPASKEAGK